MSTTTITRTAATIPVPADLLPHLRAAVATELDCAAGDLASDRDDRSIIRMEVALAECRALDTAARVFPDDVVCSAATLALAAIESELEHDGVTIDEARELVRRYDALEALRDTADQAGEAS